MADLTFIARNGRDRALAFVQSADRPSARPPGTVCRRNTHVSDYNDRLSDKLSSRSELTTPFGRWVDALSALTSLLAADRRSDRGRNQ